MPHVRICGGGRGDPGPYSEQTPLRALAWSLATEPENLLQALVDSALELTGAGSAGVSLLEGAETPCGLVLDRDDVLLFQRPEQHFPYPVVVEPPQVEALLVPFPLEGRTWRAPAGAPARPREPPTGPL